MPTGVGAVAATNEDAAALGGIAAAFFAGRMRRQGFRRGGALEGRARARNREKSFLL